MSELEGLRLETGQHFFDLFHVNKGNVSRALFLLEGVSAFFAHFFDEAGRFELEDSGPSWSADSKSLEKPSVTAEFGLNRASFSVFFSRSDRSRRVELESTCVLDVSKVEVSRVESDWNSKERHGRNRWDA